MMYNSSICLYYSIFYSSVADIPHIFTVT